MSRWWGPALALSIAACAATGPAEGPPAETRRLVWPAPPELARIEYLTAFGSAADLGLRQSFLGRARDLLAGGNEHRLVRPYSIAVDDGLVVVADPGAGLVHLFETGRGRYRQLTSAGAQRFVTPIGVALGGDRLFIADAELGRVFILGRRFEARSEIAGFRRPTSVAYDPERQITFVSDTRAHQVKAFERSGKLAFTIGERGEQPGQFNYPSHIAFSNGRLFVNDTLNYRVQIFDRAGRHLRSFGKHGIGSGHLAQSKGLAVDSDGHVYVADALSAQVQIFDQNGAFLLGFGGEGDEPGSFQLPAGLAIWQDEVYVADSHNRRVQVFRYLPEAR